MSQQLTFQGTLLSTTLHNNSIYFTASELAKALQYKFTDAVTKIYNRNQDEFTSEMSLTVKMTVKGYGNGNSEKEVRIFSLRGAHLIAMFSKTPVAKAFRKWVLDILDKEIHQTNNLLPENPEIDCLVSEHYGERLASFFNLAERLSRQAQEVGSLMSKLNSNIVDIMYLYAKDLECLMPEIAEIRYICNQAKANVDKRNEQWMLQRQALAENLSTQKGYWTYQGCLSRE